jgi:hypothetical protein
VIDYGKIRKPPKQVKDNVWIHETEVWQNGKMDHTNAIVEEHRKTSVQTLLGDLVDVAALAKTKPISIEIRHGHSKFPQLLVVWYKKEI